MTAQVIQLSPHENLTPEEALGFAQRLGWKEVIIIGTDNNEHLQQLSSSMVRERAVFLFEVAKLAAIEDSD